MFLDLNEKLFFKEKRIFNITKKKLFLFFFEVDDDGVAASKVDPFDAAGNIKSCKKEIRFIPTFLFFLILVSTFQGRPFETLTKLIKVTQM